MEVMENLQVVWDVSDLYCLCSAGFYLFPNIIYLKVIENLKIVQWAVARSTLLLLNLLILEVYR